MDIFYKINSSIIINLITEIMKMLIIYSFFSIFSYPKHLLTSSTFVKVLG